MKKIIFLSLIVSLCFSFNNLEESKLLIHSHNHLHIQGNSHVHEHSHIDSSLNLFYQNQFFKFSDITSQKKYLDSKKTCLNPIGQDIFRPPII